MFVFNRDSVVVFDVETKSFLRLDNACVAPMEKACASLPSGISVCSNLTWPIAHGGRLPCACCEWTMAGSKWLLAGASWLDVAGSWLVARWICVAHLLYVIGCEALVITPLSYRGFEIAMLPSGFCYQPLLRSDVVGWGSAAHPALNLLPDLVRTRCPCIYRCPDFRIEDLLLGSSIVSGQGFAITEATIAG
ncbi:hypothetical protein ACLOJK_034275 [Asimina triloba]